MPKVVWYEGMTLDPQHFQQWDRYHEERVDARVEGVSRLAWGLAALEIDADRLANGTFALRACSGILPDGLVFDLPDAGPLPAPRPVEAVMEPTETEVDVVLAIPAEDTSRGLIQRPVRTSGAAANGSTGVPGDGGAPIGEAGSGHARYTAVSAAFRDDTTGADEQSIEVGRTNVQVRFAGESMSGYTTLPVARVVRTGGAFALDPTFVPPVLHLGVSDRLQVVAERVLEMLVTKSRALSERQREAASQREFAPADALRLGTLSTVNTYIPALRHHLAGADDHPAAFFRTLSMLAGALAAYAPALPAPHDLPTYDHRAATRPVAVLFDGIRSALQEVQTGDTYHRLPLEQRRETLFVAALSPDDLQGTQLLLAARSEARTEEQIVQALPHMLRIAAPSVIDQVLGLSVSALRVEPTRRIPPGMPVDERASYFRLLQHGPYWDAIAEEQSLALFLPSEYADVSLDLIAT